MISLNFASLVTASDGSPLPEKTEIYLSDLLAEEIICKSPSGNPMKMIPWTGILRKQSEAAKASGHVIPLEIDDYDSKLLEGMITENKTVFLYVKYAMLQIIESARKSA